MLELIAGQAGFQVGLVITPGLTGLQDSPDGSPAKRSLPVQAHMPGDGSGSLQDRGRGRMASRLRARVADAEDRVNGHVAGAGPQQVLVHEISVAQNGPRGSGAQVHGGRPRHLRALQACRPPCRVAAGSLLEVRVIARLALQAEVDIFERREGKLPCAAR